MLDTPGTTISAWATKPISTGATGSKPVCPEPNGFFPVPGKFFYDWIATLDRLSFYDVRQKLHWPIYRVLQRISNWKGINAPCKAHLILH